MVYASVHCPTCHSTDVVKHGKTSDEKQRFLCQNPNCSRQTFLTTYVYKRRLPDVKEQILEMAMNGSGIRDTARVLHISPTTVIDTLKKEPEMQVVNDAALSKGPSARLHVVIQKVEEAEMDEMWSFVGYKGQQRWLWHAIDHPSGTVLAYVFGTHTDAVFLQLKKLLAPFGILHVYTDEWGADQHHLLPEQHEIGKQHTQKSRESI